MWCVHGVLLKAEIEKAMDNCPNLCLQVRYHPFELIRNPGTGRSKEHLVKNLGRSKVSPINTAYDEIAAEEGLLMDFSKQKVIPNTRMAHASSGRR
jgi:predicted DsbA family dithiol-disulfide isomerase